MSQTLTDHHLKEINFEQSPSDFSFFFKRMGKKLTGLRGSYVDDLLRASHPDVREYLKASIRSCFDCKDSKEIGFGQPLQAFAGLDLSRTHEGFTASMRTNIARMSKLAADATFDEYRRQRAKLVWICNARPDICAFVSLCSSVTADTFTRTDIKGMNDRVRHLQQTNKDVELSFRKLDPKTLHLLVYTDASFGTRLNKGSQGGTYVCLLTQNAVVSQTFTPES
jgi:hypothetical protein